MSQETIEDEESFFKIGQSIIAVLNFCDVVRVMVHLLFVMS